MVLFGDVGSMGATLSNRTGAELGFSLLNTCNSKIDNTNMKIGYNVFKNRKFI